MVEVRTITQQLDEVMAKLTEYLMRPSEDGRPIRQVLRSELYHMLMRYELGGRHANET
jgi:hypothetical protein